MEEPIPYDVIQETRDRSWTQRLLERLITPNVSQDELDQITQSLERLDDPRAVESLVQIMEDRGYSDAVRQAAAYVFLWGGREPHPERRHDYWLSGDAILQSYAILQMGPEDAEIIEAVASNPDHPCHRDAIGSLEFGFEQPKFQQVKIDALKHPDPVVRRTAAAILLWIEPVRAEKPLIVATSDPDSEVVDNTAATLKYYHSQRVLMHLRQMSFEHPDDQIRSTATDSYVEVRGYFADAAAEQSSRDHIRRWLAPIWDEIAFTEDELTDEEYTYTPSERTPDPTIDVKEVYSLLDNPDTPLSLIFDLFWHRDWNGIPLQERESLARYLLRHSDLCVRDNSPKVFSGWGMQDALIELIKSQDLMTRKSAMYWLGHTMPLRQEIAELAWGHLQDPSVWGTHAYESLDTYCIHADRDEAVERMVAIADDRSATETLRCRAIHRLSEWQVDTQLEYLMRHLLDAPVITWSLHIALLGAAENRRIVPSIHHELRAVDNLDVQVALAPFSH